ncbi:hypothetical protein K523DRAFT_242211 [Schizophyllum commune Tattone D]|nr:hypothetical protein K523DRAFT_242211 [Schizophyllum commune Tattone D]
MSALSDSSSYEDPTAYEVRLRKYSQEIAEHTIRQWNAMRAKQEQLDADTTELEKKMARTKLSAESAQSPQRRGRSDAEDGQQGQASGKGYRAHYGESSEQQRNKSQSGQQKSESCLSFVRRRRTYRPPEQSDAS